MTHPQQISRLGSFTASMIWQIMKSGRRKDELFGDTAMTYIHERIAEYITGECKAQPSGMALDWGNNYEKDAAMWLQQTIPFTYHGKENFIYIEYNKFAGGSPDGLSEDAAIELKCPFNSANHIRALLASKASEHNEWLKDEHFDYYVQLQFNMACAKRKKGVFASYDPRTIEAEHRMAILHIDYDEVLLRELDMRLNKAIEFVKTELTKLGYLK